MAHISAKSGLAEIELNGQSVSAKHKFKVTQSYLGNALVFSIGEDGHLYSITEGNKNQNQWTQVNLTKQLSNDLEIIDFSFSNDLEKIDLIIAAKVDGKHQLYTSFQNEINNDLNTIKWKHIAYDDLVEEQPRFSNLNITQVDILTIEEEQSLSVLTKDDNRLFRYYLYLDANIEEKEQVWQPRQLGLDYDNAPNLSLCMGTSNDGSLPGVYTLGKLSDKSELLFTPLFDLYDPEVNPSVTPLPLNGIQPDAMASVLKEEANSELFLVTEGKLYLYPEGQKTLPIVVFEHELFQNVKTLEAFLEHEHYIVWGLNQNKEVFYTTCPVEEKENSAAWSNPITIQRNIEQLSSFYNKITKELTYFTNDTYGHLVHLVRCPKTLLWSNTPVLLSNTAANSKKKLTGYKSTLQILDDEGKTLPNAAVQIRTKKGISARVLINKIHKKVTDKGLLFEANEHGIINIEEITDSLQATEFEVFLDEQLEIVSINPMDVTIGKINQINSSEDLAKFNWAEEKNSKEKNEYVQVLNKIGESYLTMRRENDEQDSIGNLYRNLSFNGSGLILQHSNDLLNFDLDGGVFDWVNDAIKKVVSTVGDVLSHAKEWITKGLKAAFVFVKGAWRLVMNIGGKLFHAVINSTKAALGAATTILKDIAKNIKDVWDKLMNISKGIDTYIFSADGSPIDIEIAGKSQTFTKGYHSFNKEIKVKDIGQNSIIMKALGKEFIGVIDPITGLLFSKDFNHLFHTPNYFVGDQVISYGFYDAGPGYIGLPNRDQAYIYVGKNQSNWMGALLKEFPDAKMHDLIIAGSHDSGMYIDIPTAVSIAGRLIVVGAGTLLCYLLPPLAPIIGPLSMAIAITYSPKRICRNMAITQKDTIADQLKLGVRYLDFRPGYNLLSPNEKSFEVIKNIFEECTQSLTKFSSEEDLKESGKKIHDAIVKLDLTSFDICHTHMIVPGGTLSEALTETINFLNEHPEEIVIISFVYSGIAFDKLKPSYDVLDKMVDEHLKYGIKKVNIVPNKGNNKIRQDYKRWKDISSKSLKSLINEGSRLIIGYEMETDDEPSSYSSYTNCFADPHAMIYGVDSKWKARDNDKVEALHVEGMADMLQKTTDTSFGLLTTQATLLNKMVYDIQGITQDSKKAKGFQLKKLLELLLALSSFSNSSAFCMATKGKIDKEVYPWLHQTLVENEIPAGEGTTIIANDFVDIGMVSIAVEATKKRLKSKSITK